MIVEVLEHRTLLSGTVLNLSVDGPVDLNGAGSVDGSDIVSLAEDQIGATDPTFDLVFDGSDVGLAGANVDAFAFLPDGNLLLSFDAAVTFGDLVVGAEDVVLFSADSLGENTAGTFSMFFDGSLFGLDIPVLGRTGNVDAIDVLDDGSLVVSTDGPVTWVADDGTVLFASASDLVRITPQIGGDFATAEIAFLTTGSQLGLTFSSENVDALSIEADGSIGVSTSGAFFTFGIGGSNEDVLRYVSDGNEQMVPVLLLNGDQVLDEMTGVNVDGLELVFVADTPNAAPLGDDVQVVLEEDTVATVQLTFTDPDDTVGSTFVFEILSGPVNGEVTLDPVTGELVYTPDADFNGTDAVTYRVIETTLDGDVVIGTAATVAFVVSAVNDAPVVVVGEPVTTRENEKVSIGGVRVSDVDAGDEPLEVVLSVENGTLSVDTTTITVSPEIVTTLSILGDGTDRLVLRGSQQEVNDLLGLLSYLGDADFSGGDSLSVTVSDLGNTGSGGPLTAAADVAVTVEAVTAEPVTPRELVADLVESGELTAGQGRFLDRLLSYRNERFASFRVRLFLYVVNRLESRGSISTDAAAELRTAGKTLLAELPPARPWWWRWRRC